MNDDARAGARAREGRVLRQEAVAGMDRLGARALRRLEHALDREVGLGRRSRTDPDRVVGETRVRRAGVGVGVDGDGADPERFEGADDADRDLAAVGHEHRPEHQETSTSAWPKRGRRFSRNERMPSAKSASRVLSAKVRISSSSCRASSPSWAWRNRRFVVACARRGPAAMRAACAAATASSSLGRDDVVHDAELEGARGLDAFVVQVELQRAAVTDVAREEVRAAGVRVRADAAVAERHDGALCRDHDVVCEHQPEAASADGSVHRGDRDLLALVQRRYQRVDGSADLRDVVVHAVARVAEDVDGAADAPRRAVGPDEDDADVRAAGGLLHMRTDLRRERDVERVPRRDVGQRDGRDPVGHGGVDAVRSTHRASNSLAITILRISLVPAPISSSLPAR